MNKILKGLFILLSISSFQSSLFAQEYTISGRVKDAANGETLIGATILITSGGGAITNEYGFYSLSLKKGKYTITYKYLGFDDLVKTIDLNQNKTVKVELMAKEIGRASCRERV